MNQDVIGTLEVEQKLKILHYFDEFISPNKKQLFEKVIAKRTRHIALAVENLYAEQNASAIVRTAECYGIQDVHILEENHVFKTPPKMAKGADKWLSLKRYNKNEGGLDELLLSLKAQNYTLVTTSPHAKDITPFNLPLHNKIALFFGEEETGITEQLALEADVQMTLPMCGFTESLNVSVCAGICMAVLRNRLEQEQIPWQLTTDEMLDLKLAWTLNNVKGAWHMLERLK